MSDEIKGTINLELTRSGIRGRASVERRERFSGGWKLRDGVLGLTWRGSNGMQHDLDCSIAVELREALLGSQKVD